MQYGIFLPNGSNGYVISEGVAPYLPTFEHQKAIVEEAEKQEFSYALPMIKFKGFGGATGFWDACLEPFTLTGALAAITSKLNFIPTVSLLALHPAYTARMTATLANISKGRVGLNIVTGWNKREYGQMDLWPGDEHYQNRYDFAGEYVSILKELWETGRCDRKSDYWKLDDCHCFPTPDYEIPIISAGQSPSGKEFCSKHADQRFMFGHPAVLDAGNTGLMKPGAYFWRPRDKLHGPYGSKTGTLILMRSRGGALSTNYYPLERPFSFDVAHQPVLPSNLQVLGGLPWSGDGVY